MARWTGHENIDAVLSAADAWRERCFLGEGSLLADAALWTLDNLQELQRRYTENPIEGSDRTFFDKLNEQLGGASAQVIHLAAEAVWFLHLFPISTVAKPETKRAQIKEVWEWSTSGLPKSPFLTDEALFGVGHPGTAYQTRRYDQFSFLLEVMVQWKQLPGDQRLALTTDNTPWQFVDWLDAFENSDRRPIRNAILYFLFPDDLERILSNEHKRQIVKALDHRLPEDLRPKGRKPPLVDIDKAIFELRKNFETELGTSEVDFYRPPVYGQWFIGIRENARSEISAALKKVLNEYDLELRQCGSKKKSLANCNPVNEKTGFWKDAADATNKPLRWIIHLEIEGNKVVARIPQEHGSHRIAFANTAQGTSGAVTARIVPAIKVGKNKFVFYETWEWLLLHCFLPALPAGSSGQLLENFDEVTGTLEYKGQAHPYIAAALIALNEPDDLFLSQDVPRAINYAEATSALHNLIHVAPTAMTEFAVGLDSGISGAQVDGAEAEPAEQNDGT